MGIIGASENKNNSGNNREITEFTTCFIDGFAVASRLVVDYFGLCVFKRAGKMWDNERGGDELAQDFLQLSRRLKTS